MRFLLTNDDGYDAPGLATLETVAGQLGSFITLAPEVVQSGCSHFVTVKKGVRVREVGERRWAVDGSPADCVRLGEHIRRDDFDWVLSGINDGGNLGADVYLSGTVAAAREAVLHGKPAVAISHYKRRGAEIDWQRVVPWLVPIINDLTARPVRLGVLWNINLPHLPPGEVVPGVSFCPVERGPLPLHFEEDAAGWHYRGVYTDRERRPGSDVDVCFGGGIAVSELHLYGY